MAQELSDTIVIQRVRNGELDYFEHLTRSYTKHIYHFIKSRLFDKNEVDDLVQNTFLSFYKALNHFDTTKPVLPYLYQIARNELKMYYRSKKQTQPLGETFPSEMSTTGNDEQSTVSAALKELTDEQQAALRLVGEGYSYKEIALSLGKPLNTIRTIIRRARLFIAHTKKHEKT